MKNRLKAIASIIAMPINISAKANLLYALIITKLFKKSKTLLKIFPLPKTLKLISNGNQLLIHTAQNTDSIDVLYEIFFLRDYRINIPEPPKIILDIGANIGISALYFSSLYPQAKIYALEPMAKNYDLLKRNTINTPNVLTYKKAVSSSSGYVKLYCDGMHPGGNTLLPIHKFNETVESTTLDDFIKEHNIPKVDLLKIDTEGAELQILKNSLCFQNINYIVGELHYWCYPKGEMLEILNKDFDITLLYPERENPIFIGTNKGCPR